MVNVAQQAARESELDQTNTTESESRTVRANKIVRNFALGSILVGAIPFPVIDMATLTAVQLTMLHSLSKVYDVEFSEQLGKSLIATLAGGGVSLSVSSNFASLAKAVPGFGTVTGMVSFSAFGSTSTYAIGKVFVKHFESGGTFLDLDPERVREYYAQQFQEGKSELKENSPGKKP
ncbi:MAG: YcjF family protein [Methylococcales bacterium]